MDNCTDWPAALTRLSDCLLLLYRLASSSAAGKFQEQALDAVRRVIDFDSAFWASGALYASGPKVHAVYCFRQPPDMMASWEKLKQHDTVLQRALMQPGRAVRATALGPEGGEPFIPEVVAHAHKYGMAHILGTVDVNAEVGLLEGFALYRADPARPFSDIERHLKECLLPHLVEAWRLNRLAALTPERRQPNPVRMATAICDQTGTLFSAAPEFAALLQMEWPTWHGPTLPNSLALRAARHVGQHIVVTLEALNDLWLLRVRQRLAVDALSQRELDIARRYAEGRSYQDIAATLHLAPATVRNHLNNIYGKLGIRDKAALANLVRRQ